VVKGLLSKLTLFSACSGLSFVEDKLNFEEGLSVVVADKEDGLFMCVFGGSECCADFIQPLE
jgi:hypothetical protein